MTCLIADFAPDYPATWPTIALSASSAHAEPATRLSPEKIQPLISATVAPHPNNAERHRGQTRSRHRAICPWRRSKHTPPTWRISTQPSSGRRFIIGLANLMSHSLAACPSDEIYINGGFQSRRQMQSERRQLTRCRVGRSTYRESMAGHLRGHMLYDWSVSGASRSKLRNIRFQRKRVGTSLGRLFRQLLPRAP